MKPIVLKTGHVNADTVAEAFAEGVGVKPELVEDYIKRNLSKGNHFSIKDKDETPIFFGILRGTGDVARSLMSTASGAKQNSFVYIDHGYIDPGHFDGYYRCCWNTLHARPDWLARSKLLPRLQNAVVAKGKKILSGPKHGDGHIVVAVPSVHVSHFWDFDREGWVRAVAARLAETAPDREVLYVQKGTGIPGEEALNGAHALVTVSSNLAISALLVGVRVFVVPPVFTGHWVDWWHPVEQLYHTGLKDVGLKAAVDIDTASQFLRQLAACQFTLDEMRKGQAWEWLLENRQYRKGIPDNE